MRRQRHCAGKLEIIHPPATSYVDIAANVLSLGCLLAISRKRPRTVGKIPTVPGLDEGSSIQLAFHFRLG